MDDILDIEMQENDAGAKTIREYLKAIVRNVWDKGEGFSGKRPFGNSGWERELEHALVCAKKVKGTIVGGYVEDCDSVKARKLIFKAIDAL